MKPIFVDTSALIAIGNKRDFFHSQAVKVKNELKNSQRIFVTTSAILLELGNAFCSTKLRPSAIKLIEAISYSKKWKCVIVNGVLRAGSKITWCFLLSDLGSIWPIEPAQRRSNSGLFQDFAVVGLVKGSLKMRCENTKLFLTQSL